MGTSVAGGVGDRKTFSLFFGEHAPRVCCGYIGATGNSKFCLRSESCGITACVRKFSIDNKAFYLKDNESRAFVHPVWPSTGLLADQVQDLLSSPRTTKSFRPFLRL